MKMNLKRVLASACAGLLAVSAISFGFPANVSAAEESTESYPIFIAFGGDAAEENDWALNYAGGDASEGITATAAEIKSGETATIKLEFANPVVNAWYFAPTMVAESVVEADFSVKCLIDGKEVAVDMAAGDNWWYEQTGDYSDKEAVRIAGGFNEWGAQYIAEPAGFTTLEYEITANTIKTGEAVVGNVTESTEEYDMFLAFGGDAAEENDWALSATGADSDGITVTNGKIKSGETGSVKLEFANPVVNAWYFAPTIIAENVVEADFTVQCLIDGKEVAIDTAAGDNWWYEATGDYPDTQAIRVAGGFNEWGAHYIEEPAGFTSLEYVITANKIMVGEPVEEAGFVSAAGPANLDGTYHAYLGVQGPKYTFRDGWDNASTGNGSPLFNQLTFQGEVAEGTSVPATINDVEIAGNGTYTVSITGIEWPEDEFAEQEFMNLIFVSTDIPNTNEIVFSDIKLSIEGAEVNTTPKLIEDVDYTSYQLQNIWDDEIKAIGYYPTPFTDIAITFTVSGFNYDNEATPADAAPADTAATDDTAAPAEDVADNTTPAKGGLSGGAIAGIIAAVVVVVGGGIGCAVVLNKKKDGDK